MSWVGECGTGYVTEKIVNAFLAGCIPIYWGSRRESLLGKKKWNFCGFLSARSVLDIFNPDSFIFANEIQALWQMVEVDQNFDGDGTFGA